jgi:NTE family protein
MSKALVLGGGGLAGVAWETGVLLGLAESGIDLTDADLLVGTSAGSVVATQVATGFPLDEMFAAQVAGGGAEQAVQLDMGELATTFAELLGDAPEPEELCRRVGALALAADVAPEEERLAIVSARLPVQEWPERPLRVTAVDTATGELVVFDRTSGVGLVDAVAASCAVPGVWPPVTIGDARYMDGGVRSGTHVDLARGHEHVVVVAPIRQGLGGDVDHECAALRAEGAEVVLITPDAASQEAFGANLLDPASREPAARAGRSEAPALADAVRAAW